MKWEILDSGILRAQRIMARDAHLLEQLPKLSHPILHLYDWQGDSATYGCFIEPSAFLNMEHVQTMNLFLAKRPTGGGIVFHISDFAFSVLIPANHPKFSINTLDNYALINQAVISTIQKIQKTMNPELLPVEAPPLDKHCQTFCMAKPTKYDVIVQNKKIGGASQRRTKFGLLHQGTISIALLPNDYLRDLLLPGTQVLEAMQKHSACLLGPTWTKNELIEMRAEIKQSLQTSIKEI